METESMTSYDQSSSTIAVPEKLPSINMLDERKTPPPPPSLACESIKNDLMQSDEQERQYAAAVAVTSSFLPPPSAAYAYNGTMHHGFYSQNMSPPLTPAVSPSSVLLDSMQFKRKFSVDVGPFSFGSGMPHPPSMHDQDAFRRSSCSAMSVDGCVHEHQQQQHHHPYSAAAAAAMAAAAAASRCPDYSFFNAGDPTTTTTVNPFAAPSAQQQQQQQQQPKSLAKRHSRSFGGQQSQGPSTQHKHVCKYAFCGWSFKRYEHLKRHMLVHTGERPHVCHFPGCGKSFSRSDNFHAHYRTHTKKSMSQHNNNRRLSHQQSASSSVVDTPISAGTVHSPSSQAFDQDRTPTAYFASARQQSFDMTPYQDMYDHRQSYSSEDNNTYHDSQQQQQQWRSFSSALSNVQTSPVAPLSPSGTSSLLNHESQSPNPFLSSLPTDRPSLGYPMHSITPTSLTNSAMAAVACYGPFGTATAATPVPSGSSRRSSSASANSSSQQKSHVCPVPQCQRRFKRLEHLKRHMRIHTLERPFACSFPNCHKTFSRSDNLSQHMKTHQRVEDRRRRQQQTGFKQPQQHLPPLHHQNGNNMSVAAAAAAAVNMGMNWHANTGTVV
ncbi:hypothetical protein DFQ28_004258 [Apophysomyces sp. BC1034]|nr:hypothetical protein DFQ30_004244 [Apophysomyces sp. BC1015]KAG0177781.1 hypothetical protein DFQ29_004332 [Apophysomyces sp. BC1021]KAG0188854.1 hypothetical protein DFQ28_004258 [Apophysomyces sp. BC1034]